MNLQSLENWSLYSALIDIKNINKFKMYRCVSTLNFNVKNIEKLEKQQTEDLSL